MADDVFNPDSLNFIDPPTPPSPDDRVIGEKNVPLPIVPPKDTVAKEMTREEKMASVAEVIEDPKKQELLDRINKIKDGRPESQIGLQDPYWGAVNAYRMYLNSLSL